MLTIQDKQNLEKLHQYIHTLHKQVLKYGRQTPMNSMITNMDSIIQELLCILIQKDLQDVMYPIQKLYHLWKEILSQTQVPEHSVTEGDITEFDPGLQLSSIKGDIGKLGGVRIQESTAASAMQMKKLTTKQMLPTIKSQQTIQDPYTERDSRTHVKYQLEENQVDILQEVLKQSYKLNVQIVMKRYDPKIKLFLSQGTDTKQDIFDVMRSYNKEDHLIQVDTLSNENQQNLEEMQKFIKDRTQINFLNTSMAADKLKHVAKSLISKTQDLELALNEAQRDEPEPIKNQLSEFVNYVQGQYKEIQDDTYHTLLRVMKDFFKSQRKQWQIQQEKAIQQSSHKKDKSSLQKKVDELTEKQRQELLAKNQELDKRNNEFSELSAKFSRLENQLLSTTLELEQVKMLEQKTEADRTQLLYENRKLEKQMSQIINKPVQDEAVQVSDTYQQDFIKKLQQENKEMQQKLKDAQFDSKSKSFMFVDENILSPSKSKQNSQHFSKLRSNDFDSNYNEQEYLSNELGSRRDLPIRDSQRQISTKIAINKSVSQYQLSISQQSSRAAQQRSNFIDQKNPTLLQHSNSEAVTPNRNQQLKIQLQLDKSQIVEQDEDNNIYQSQKLTKSASNAQFKIQQQQSFVNRKDQKIDGINKTEDGTVIDTMRTGSGRHIKTERTKSGKFSRIEQSPSARRIQTDDSEFAQEITFTSAENKTQLTFKKNNTLGPNQQRIKNSSKSKGNSKGYIDLQQDNSSDQQRKRVNFDEKIEEQGSDHEKSGSKSPFNKQQSSPNFRKNQLMHLKRQSSTGTAREIQMAIKLNDQEQVNYNALWVAKHQDEEVQTDNQYLISLMENMMNEMNLPQEMIQNSIEKLKQQYSNDSILPQAIFDPKTSQFQKYYPRQKTGLDIQSKEQLQDEDQLQKAGSGQNKSRNLDKSNKQKGQLQGSGSPSQQQIKQSTPSNKITTQQHTDKQQKEALLYLAENDQDQNIINLDPKDENYEQQLLKLMEAENNNQPLEPLKSNELNQQTIEKIYKTMNSKMTKGTLAIQEMIKKYYDKAANEQISFGEFKGFYQKLSVLHKQCGQNTVCLHLQRFFMRLGFILPTFSRRQVLKTSLSTVKPFTSNKQENQTPINQKQRQKFISSQYYVQKS